MTITEYTNVEFPFEEIKDNGDYFHSPHDLRKLGYAESQIWSVVIGNDDELDDGGDRWLYITYGPSGHYVNVEGYFATKEHHDGHTYYQEALEMEPLG